MSKVDLKYGIPSGSNLEKHAKQYHYVDSFSIKTQTTKSVEDITLDIFEIPDWVNTLVKVRNFLVRPLGLYKPPQKGQKKEWTLPFKVMEYGAQELIMGETDKHLNFWLSVQKEAGLIHVTTVVLFHNMLGRLYFLPVKPLHKIIVRSLLRGLCNKVEKEMAAA